MGAGFAEWSDTLTGRPAGCAGSPGSPGKPVTMPPYALSHLRTTAVAFRNLTQRRQNSPATRQVPRARQTVIGQTVGEARRGEVQLQRAVELAGADATRLVKPPVAADAIRQ